MKTKIATALALVLLAGSASAALAQDDGGHRGGRGDGGQSDGGYAVRGGDRGPHRSNFQGDPAGGAPPLAPVAPQAPVAAPAAQPRPQHQGNAPQRSVRANRDIAGRQQDAARQQQDAARQQGADRREEGNPGGANDGRRGGGDRNNGFYDNGRNNGLTGPGRNNGFTGPGRNNGPDRHDYDRRDYDRRGGDRGGWDHRDDHGRPHWQQGRYPEVYRSQQRYRYGYYRPPAGFFVRNWAFGDVLPRGWWGSDYYLGDWWSFGLPYPPPGLDWVRVGSDALLIDNYDGRVVQVVRDLFW